MVKDFLEKVEMKLLTLKVQMLFIQHVKINYSLLLTQL